jgi:histidyl-tRNA synthetase
MPPYKAPRGAPDLIPPRSEQMQKIVRSAEDLFRVFGYRRIDTPIFEETEVFERSLDEGSDMVNKEMYTFPDRSGRSLTLRPEGTAPVVRAILEHNLHRGHLPVKLCYTAPSFRYERPQAGRQRTFLQLGVEAVGSPGPEIDAEVIELGTRVFETSGLRPELRLNSIGHPACRANYMPILREYLNSHLAEMSEDNQRKIQTNPLRTFDSKAPEDIEVMASAPLITLYLCDDCTAHFNGVRALLDQAGVTYMLDPRLVRGIDYYTRTTFAWILPGLGAQNEGGGGGRYDGLSELLGGPPLPGIGFGLGADRILLAIEKAGAEADGWLDVFVAYAGKQGPAQALRVASELRAAGLSTDLDFDARRTGAQFKAANRAGARHVVVVGDREVQSGRYTVRDMTTGKETEVERSALVDFLAKDGAS